MNARADLPLQDPPGIPDGQLAPAVAPLIAPLTDIRTLGRRDYATTWAEMKAFTARRGADTPDELWIVEHAPVYTLGLATRPEHLPRSAGGIPVHRVDRGGQITYHGPGQAVVYTLVDLARRGFKVREWVHTLEQAVIELLAAHGVSATRRAGAPGVYVGEEGAKIAALGLRVRHGCAYHGVALNVAMDLTPFSDIDPCGYAGLAVTRTRDLGIAADAAALGAELARRIAAKLQP